MPGQSVYPFVNLHDFRVAKIHKRRATMRLARLQKAFAKIGECVSGIERKGVKIGFWRLFVIVSQNVIEDFPQIIQTCDVRRYLVCGASGNVLHYFSGNAFEQIGEKFFGWYRAEVYLAIEQSLIEQVGVLRFAFNAGDFEP